MAEGRVVDYAAALHQAKRRLRPKEATSSPYFWAPFVLIGTPTSGGAGDSQEPLAVTRE
jgi:CHAT domain-containing protein